MAIPEQTLPASLRADLPTEQRPMGAPVVFAPELPSMERVGEVRTVSRNTALPLMGTAATADTRGANLMTGVPARADPSPRPSPGPQEPKEGQVRPAPSDGYVRLEFHVENGQLSVIGVKEVPGPLVIPSAVIHGLVYEVLIGDQQIALGSLPDVGLRRAFANRDVPGPEGKHHFVQVPDFDFFARIPKAQVSNETLARLTIVVHNVQQAPDRLVPAIALQRQPGIETTEVARLSGLSLERLPAVVRPQFDKILQDNR